MVEDDLLDAVRKSDLSELSRMDKAFSKLGVLFKMKEVRGATGSSDSIGSSKMTELSMITGSSEMRELSDIMKLSKILNYH